MLQNNSGTPLVKMAVRAVLTGGTAIASLGVAEAQVASTAAPGSADNAPLEVVVTGSRLAIPNNVSISPVTSVSAETIAQTGVTKVEDLLNELPQVYAGQSSTVVNGADGTAQVNLRGLGAKRTLVLVDGLRLGPGDPRSAGASDLNMIPEALIDSVELLTGGASSTYGADAVSGVVNFKLNNHYEGVKVVASGSFYDHENTNVGGVITDLQNFNSANGTNYPQAPGHVDTGGTGQIAFIAGLNSSDGKGNATFYATYRHVAPALQSKYSISECSLASGYAGSGGDYGCAGSSTGYPGRFQLNQSGAPVNTIGPNGTLVPFNATALFNYGPLNYFMRPEENYTAGAFLHYDFNEHVSVYANSMFMDDRSFAQIAPSGAFSQAYSVNCDNPLLSGAEVGAWCGGNATPGTSTSLLIGRRNIEGGNRYDDLQHTDFREVIGAKGVINDAWSYDASLQYSQVELQETYYNDVSIAKVNYALDAVRNPAENGVAGVAAGAPVCAVTLANAQAGVIPTGAAFGCQPWNIFTPGGVNAAQAAYLDTPADLRGELKTYIVNVNFSGDLGKYGVKLPTANSGVLVNFGGEYRDETSRTVPDMEFQTGDLAGQGGPTTALNGGILVRDGFFEAHVPIMDDQPFAKSLALDMGYRFSGYRGTLEEDTNTYKFGVEWSPSSDYRVRGSFTRAVRAPNISELFSTQSIALDGTADPCAGGTPAYSQAQCARLGVPEALYGKVSSNSAAQYNGLIGGNPKLKPETALTKSFGIGWTPSYVPNLRVQVDWYDIAIQNVISGYGFGTILSECGNGNDSFCGYVHRDSAQSSLWLNNGYVDDTLQNAGKMEQKGIDVDVGYSYSLGTWGKLTANFNGTWIDQYTVQPITSDPTTQYDCSGYYGVVCSNGENQGPNFRWRHTLRVNWMTPFDGVSLGVAWRYFSPVTLDGLQSNPNLNGVTACGSDCGNATPQESTTDSHISSYSYIDLTAAWRINDNVGVRVGVNNVLDKNPPVIGITNLAGGNGNTYPQFYDALGRYIFAEATVQF